MEMRTGVMFQAEGQQLDEEFHYVWSPNQGRDKKKDV